MSFSVTWRFYQWKSKYVFLKLKTICFFLPSHESECPFREIHCPDMDCRIRSPISKLLDHIELDHQDKTFSAPICQSNHRGYIDISQEHFDRNKDW